MSSLEDLSPEQQQQALRLFSFVKQNPEIEKIVRREAKKKNPSMSAPDIELEDALEKQAADFRAELAKRDEQSLAQLQTQRREEAHSRIKAAGLDPDEVEKAMVDESIGNYDTAIKYVRAQKSLAQPTHESATPMTLPDSKELWSDKNKFARSAAFDAINELKAGRRLGS